MTTATRRAILDALKGKKGGLDGKTLKAKTGLSSGDIRLGVKLLMNEGAVIGEGAFLRLAPPVSEIVHAKAVGQKLRKAPEPEEDDEEVSEDIYTPEELDTLVEEYQELGDKKRLSKDDKERLAAIEEVLEANGMFDEEDVEDGPDEDDEEDEHEIGDEDEEDEEPEEDDFDFTEDEDEHDTDDEIEDEHDDDDEDEKPKSKVKGQQAKVALPDTAFSLAFKPIDTLGVDELAERIEAATDAAQELAEDGHPLVAEMLMRSVAKARKQYNKKTS